MNLKRFLILVSSLLFILLFPIKSVYAHCPLCTVGAAVAAGGAIKLGISEVIVGLLIGAFAVSIGWWVSRLIKKQYIPYQRLFIILLSFIATVGPLLPIVKGVHPIYISLIGDYGSLLNRTYLLNLFLIGSIFGGLIVSFTPWLSSKIAELRNGKIFPFQGVILTFVILAIVAVVIQLTIV